jgi:predicted kinase
VLLLINGAPGVGKSALAQRYADEHPLALIVDIDSIRTRLGQWAVVDESKLVARDLALALIRAHLHEGRDVVVAQYLGRPEFREQLAHVARELGAPFVEVVLTDDADRITARFRKRRAEHAAAGVAHPEADLTDAAVANGVQQANDLLLVDATARGVLVVSADAGVEVAYRALCDELIATSKILPPS